MWIGCFSGMSEAEHLAAIEADPAAIRFMDSPTESLQLAAVRQNGSCVAFIANPSAAVQLAAVENMLNAIAYIYEPCEVVQLIIVEHGLFRAVRQLAPDVQHAYDMTRALGLDWGNAGFSETLRAAYAGLKNQDPLADGSSENPGLT